MTTGAGGRYTFWGLSAGEYRVSVQLAPGFAVTTAAEGYHPVTLVDDTDRRDDVLVGVHQPRPDLVVSDVVAPAAAEINDAVQVEWMTANVGDKQAVAPWQVRLLLSEDQYLSGDDVTLATYQETQVLDVGEQRTSTLSANIPPLPEGDYYVLVIANHRGDAGEEVAYENKPGHFFANRPDHCSYAGPGFDRGFNSGSGRTSFFQD